MFRAFVEERAVAVHHPQDFDVSAELGKHPQELVALGDGCAVVTVQDTGRQLVKRVLEVRRPSLNQSSSGEVVRGIQPNSLLEKALCRAKMLGHERELCVVQQLVEVGEPPRATRYTLYHAVRKGG